MKYSKSILLLLINIIFYTNSFSQTKSDCIFCCELNDKTIHINEDCKFSDCYNSITCQDYPCTFPTGNIISKPIHGVLQFSAKIDQS